jgi:hypothetical protein
MKGTPDQMAHINAEIQKLVDAMDIKVEVDAKPERRKYVIRTRRRCKLARAVSMLLLSLTARQPFCCSEHLKCKADFRMRFSTAAR